MTIRAKLYAAIVLTVLGPLATIVVALNGMAQMGDRFDEVQQRAEHESIARELKFAVTDVNGWQTAYGYAGSDLRQRDELRRVYLHAEAELEQDLEAASNAFAAPRERGLLALLESDFDRFRQLDAIAWRALQAGEYRRTKQILLGPEIERFEAMAATAERLAAYEAERATATERDFDNARDDARRQLIAVALGAGLVIILLLVTANDIARMALEGERSVRGERRRDPPGDDPS